MKKFIVASLAATGVATQPIVTCMEQHCMSEGIACLNDAGCKQAIQCAEKCPTSGPAEKSCVMKCYGSSPDKAETDLLKCAEQSKCIPSLHDPVRVSMYKTTVVTFDASSHYEDPKNGCQNGEVDIQIQGVAGKMCAPSCGLFRKCPTDVPTGVTAKPQCALQASTGGKYCALICSPSTDEISLRAGDSQCGENASCKAISGVGICTYDDDSKSLRQTASHVGTYFATPHYEDPNKTGGCQNGEVDIQIQGVAGKMCAPSCGLFRKCPTDKPSGVTAQPQCALQASTGGKYCALICSPSAGDAQCGENASCKSISGTGVCTYDK